LELEFQSSRGDFDSKARDCNAEIVEIFGKDVADIVPEKVSARVAGKGCDAEREQQTVLQGTVLLNGRKGSRVNP